MHGFLSSIEPQNDFFLMPMSVNVVRAGKVVPEISTVSALRQVYLLPPLQSHSQRPPCGSSFRTLSHSDAGIVILIVITLSSAEKESIACCCCAVIAISVRAGFQQDAANTRV